MARPVAGLAAETLAAARRIVAVDVPSGVDGATGATLGFAPQAELTVTFFRLKPGHMLFPGRGLCGEILVRDIGMPVAVLDTIQPKAWVNLPDLWSLPVPGAADHKYTRGHVSILGGAEMTGAARLAAAGARRAGAGLVSIVATANGDVYRAGEPGVIVTESPLQELLADARRNIWICGPGLGVAAARTALPVLLAARRVVVGDADVFGAFAGDPDALTGCAVLTPHLGEFSRVFGAPGQDRLDAARAASARTGAVLVLKGADTVIAAPDGRVAINNAAPPWLATAGAGDVLAGMIGGLLGQGMAAWEAACAAVWLHGRAAALGGAGLVAEDISSLIPHAIREISDIGMP